MKNTLAIAQCEIVRLFMTRRGWWSIAAFALVWFVIVRMAILPASRFLGGNSDNALLRMLLGEVNLESLATWLIPELSVYWVFCLLFLPLFCIVLTADQIASDLARGTLRFLHLRATRGEIFFGRFLGQMLVQLMFILVTMSTTLALAAYRDPSILGTELDRALIIIINLMIVLLPFTALMALASVLARSGRQAILFAVISLIVVWLALGYLSNYLPDAQLLHWVMPWSQILPLMRQQAWDTLQLAPIPLMQTCVLLLVGWMLMRRVNL